VSDAKKTLRPELDVNGCFNAIAGEHGLERASLDALVPAAREALEALASKRAAGDLPFYELPNDEAGIAECRRSADALRGRFDTLVVLGIGGSALGTRAALGAVPESRRSAGAKHVRVLDNVDPSTIGALFDSLDLERTAFNVISKSGQTPETMSQFLVARERLIAAFGEQGWAEHVICTTDPDGGVLHEIAKSEGISMLPVPPGVGGRFSVLSAVGLMPMAFAGLDIESMAAGARAMDERVRTTDPLANPAALHAMVLFLAMTTKNAAMHVLMPYSDRLYLTAEWYAQLWAESLGKRNDLEGRRVETGQTPVRALGATDQHSQVQLYIEGPHDKVITFLRVEDHGPDLPIPRAYDSHEALACLAGHGLGDLLNMEQRATETALNEAGRLTTTITVPAVDEAAIGALFHLFEVQTLVAGALLGIDPLDQPGVEAGKRLTYAMAGRSDLAEVARSVRERFDARDADLILG
jgi:glucose-6-phosphate isomerase